MKRYAMPLARCAVGVGLLFGVSTIMAQSAAPATADLVLVNGNILTVDAAFSSAQAVAIVDGKFAAVGGNDDIAPYVGQGTRRIDLQGRTVIPGLLDNHLHQLSAALNAPHVSLLDARSIEDVKQAIGKRVSETPSGQWVRASSAWHESTLKEGRLPTRHDLDGVSPDNPVYIPRGGHVVTVNSAALKLADITRDTPNPDGGVIVRDANGDPTGVLLESAAKMMGKNLPPPPSPAQQAVLLKDFMRQLNSYGVVGVVEPGLNASQIDVYNKVHAAGDMSVRTRVLYRISGLEDAKSFLQSYQRAPGDGMLALDGVKYLLDGGVEGAYLNEPYQIVEGEQPDPNYRGVLLLPKGGQSELIEAFKQLAQAGWQVQTHAVGDATIDAALDAYAEVAKQSDIGKLRWALMHVFLPSANAMQRMTELDVLATVQDHAILLGHNQLRYWGQERAAYAIPTRSLLNAGVGTSGGTDAPVLPANPFLSLSWMVTRELTNGSILGAEQAVSRKEALRLWTIDSAYLMSADRQQGSIEVGKRADLVVLSENYMTVPSQKIKEIGAIMTVLGGKIVHDTTELGKADVAAAS